MYSNLHLERAQCKTLLWKLRPVVEPTSEYSGGFLFLGPLGSKDGEVFDALLLTFLKFRPYKHLYTVCRYLLITW